MYFNISNFMSSKFTSVHFTSINFEVLFNFVCFLSFILIWRQNQWKFQKDMIFLSCFVRENHIISVSGTTIQNCCDLLSRIKNQKYNQLFSVFSPHARTTTITKQWLFFVPLLNHQLHLLLLCSIDFSQSCLFHFRTKPIIAGRFVRPPN